MNKFNNKGNKKTCESTVGSTNSPQLKFTMNPTPTLGSRQSNNASRQSQIKLASHTGMMSSSAPLAPASTSSTVPSVSINTTKSKATNHFQQHLQLINAPTSLANLAQFGSGITLVPVGTLGSGASTVDDDVIIDSVVKPKQHNTLNGKPNISFSSGMMSNSSQDRMGSSKNGCASGIDNNISFNYVSTQPKPLANGSGGNARSLSTKHSSNSRQKSLANLAANMPSIQIINARSPTTTTTTTDEMTIWHTQGDSVTNRVFNGNHKGTGKKGRNAKKGGKQKSVNTFNDDLPQYDDIPPPPVLDNAPIFDDLEDYSQPIVQPIDTNLQIEASSDSPIITIGSAEDANNGTFNDISLLKLMAILNNPAITITPVDPNKSAASSASNPSSSQPQSSNNLAGFQQLVTLKMSANSKATVSDHQDNSCGTSVQPNVGTPSRNGPMLSSIGHGQFAAPNRQEAQTNWSDFILGGSVNNQSATLSWVNSTQANMIPDEPNDLQFDNLDATNLSASVRDYVMQHQPSTDDQPPTVSIQLLKHIADQNKDNSWDSSIVDKSILEPECILKVPRRIFDFGKGVTIPVAEKLVSIQEIPPKQSKPQLKTSKKRLFIPRRESEQSKIKMRCLGPEAFLKPIIVEDGPVMEKFLSQRHRILHSMSTDSKVEDLDQNNPSVDPDEIFVNRSKRVMSKIDTMLERKKRRRFERISSREAPTSKTLEELCDDSDAEWSDDPDACKTKNILIETQLPLDEQVSQRKKDYLSSVGLVTLEDANKIEVETIKRKLDRTSALGVADRFAEPDEDIKRFASAIYKTGGTDIQMRIESNIKRNELPFIEGLNRNTSRVKMTYMSILGLEKRSKRTTLYKIKPTSNESTQQINSQPKPIIDLKQEPVNLPVAAVEKQQNEPQSHQQQQPNLTSLQTSQRQTQPKLSRTKDQAKHQHLQQAIITNAILNNLANGGGGQSLQESKSGFSSCREAIVAPPKKDEYMKSLGLMAS